MIYSASITTTAATAKADATITRLRVTKGLVWLMEVEFPAGCCGLAHIQVFDGSYQVLPVTPGDSLHSDGAVLSYDDLYLKTAAPFSLTVKTWNLDETNPHTLQVRIGLASSQEAMSRYMPSLTWDNYAAQMAKIQKDQEAVRQAQISQMAKDLGG